MEKGHANPEQKTKNLNIKQILEQKNITRDKQSFHKDKANSSKGYNNHKSLYI